MQEKKINLLHRREPHGISADFSRRDFEGQKKRHNIVKVLGK